MKIIIIMLGVAFLALACSSNMTMAENKTKEPSALTLARNAYNAQAKTIKDPISKKYLAQLEELKKQLGGKGDLEGALAVQKEIEEIKKTVDSATQKPIRSKSGTEDKSISLLTLKPEEARTGWASVRYGKNAKRKSAGGVPVSEDSILVDGNSTDDFIDAHAASFIQYKIPSGMKYFSAKGGTQNSRRVLFVVLADEKELFRSRPLSELNSSTVDVFVELPAGAKKLKLIIDLSGDGNGQCWTFWYFPKFMNTKQDKDSSEDREDDK